jgi:hypothetical protein
VLQQTQRVHQPAKPIIWSRSYQVSSLRMNAESLESDLWKRCWALCDSLQRNWKQVALPVLESAVAFSLEKADLHLDGEHLPQ